MIGVGQEPKVGLVKLAHGGAGEEGVGAADDELEYVGSGGRVGHVVVLVGFLRVGRFFVFLQS